MRLTLRTLLAYLDDCLSPSQAKELGERISASPYASKLASRIREVVRRRRIGAPEVIGPGSTPDANVVAEYIDSLLPPAAESDYERICFESDAHLAEVAACHQILTNVKGEPVTIPPGVRERMYALGSASESEVTALDAASDTFSQPDHTAQALGVHPVLDAPTELPEVLRTGSQGKRLVTFAAAGLVLAGWLAVMITDDTWRGLWPADSATATQGDETPVTGAERLPVVLDEQAPQGIQPDSPQITAVAAAEPVPAETSVATAATEQEPATETLATPPQLPLDVPAPDQLASAPRAMPAEIDQTAAPEADSPLPRDDKSLVSEPAPESADPIVSAPIEVETTPVPAAPPLPEPLELQYASTEGILLQQIPGAADWMVLPRRALVYPDETLACPPPFDARLKVGSGDLQILMQSGARVRSLGTTTVARCGLDVDQGRVVIHLPGEPQGEQTVIALQIRDQLWRLEPLEAGTVFAIEVTPVTPTAEDDRRGATECGGGLFVVRGSATVSRDGGDVTHHLQPGSEWLAWSFGPTAPSQPEPMLAVPGWSDPQGVTLSAVQRRYATLYEKEFAPDQPVADSIAPVVKDRQPRIAELATQTMAVTDNVSALVVGLGSEHEEARLAAIVGLREWLPRSEENGQVLLNALAGIYRQPDAEILQRLLWGFSDQDARNEFTSQELVEWLSHQELAVRELAIFHLYRLTDRRYDYYPNAAAPQREAAANRWRDFLKQGKMRLVP